jgi:hypothetical protein
MISLLNRTAHAGMDAIMCAMMNTAQWRLRRHAVSKERLEEYLTACEKLDHRAYYATPAEDPSMHQPEWRRDGHRLSWTSPLQGPHRENNTARALLYDAKNDTKDPGEAPTLILMHALMSANDLGYRRIASRFNLRGWNVLFPHLPYHYSRRPKGYANGALTITSDIVRNAETLKQSVIELRQLIDWSRDRGAHRIALLATSYGAWVAALALSMEETDFSILLQPVADVRQATFGSPASRMMAGLLKGNGIHPEAIDRHAHLSSPPHLTPRTRPERITIVGGCYDRLSPSDTLIDLSNRWGARYLEVEQGHFGYGAMKLGLAEADRLIATPTS